MELRVLLLNLQAFQQQKAATKWHFIEDEFARRGKELPLNLYEGDGFRISLGAALTRKASMTGQRQKGKTYRPFLASHLSWRKSMKDRTPDELERAIEDIGYVIHQTFTAHQIFHGNIIAVLRKDGIDEDLIHGLNNASLESQLLFLRKLNEFFKHLPKNRELEEDDLRAEHYSGFQSPGAFLRGPDEKEIHRRVGHITLLQVRYGPKNWAELINSSLPVAVDRLLQFFVFLRDSYPSLSAPTREDVQFYIETLEQLKRLV